MTTDDNAFSAKISKKFYCAKCNYYTSRSFNLKQHLNSIKHKNNENNNENNSFSAKISKTYYCVDCNKTFKDRAGLWRHNKSIHVINKNSQLYVTTPSSDHVKDDMIIELLKQNKELLELVKNGTVHNNNHITTHTNSHNKSFNLNLFLNETCKNAMNITDFVESIKLQLTDLMEVGKLGYVEGISNIIIKNLCNLDETERPIHCTDKKRETFYVKDCGQWEREDTEKKHIKHVITNVAYKNQKLLQLYKDKHPGCNYSESNYSDEYSKLVIEAMGGFGNDDKQKEEKIIRNISRVTTIQQK